MKDSGSNPHYKAISMLCWRGATWVWNGAQRLITSVNLKRKFTYYTRLGHRSIRLWTHPSLDGGARSMALLPFWYQPDLGGEKIVTTKILIKNIGFESLNSGVPPNQPRWRTNNKDVSLYGKRSYIIVRNFRFRSPPEHIPPSSRTGSVDGWIIH